MGVDTKVLLMPAPDILDVLRYLDGKYSRVTLSSASNDFYWACFKDGVDERQLAIFPPYKCASDYAEITKEPAVYISMGMWGNSEIIARGLATHFGGMIMVNDSKDNWTRP